MKSKLSRIANFFFLICSRRQKFFFNVFLMMIFLVTFDHFFKIGGDYSPNLDWNWRRNWRILTISHWLVGKELANFSQFSDWHGFCITEFWRILTISHWLGAGRAPKKIKHSAKVDALQVLFFLCFFFSFFRSFSSTNYGRQCCKAAGRHFFFSTLGTGTKHL